MINLDGKHKPTKMLKKINAAIKRSYTLYQQPSRNWRGKILREGTLKNSVNPTIVGTELDKIANHLWYKHCGFTLEEFRALVQQEYDAFKLMEILHAS